MTDRRMAGKANAGVPKETEADPKDSEERGRKQGFAQALARSEFGRFYWDDRLEAELRRQLALSKQRWKS